MGKVPEKNNLYNGKVSIPRVWKLMFSRTGFSNNKRTSNFILNEASSMGHENNPEC